jgi:polyphosphate kinase
LSGSLEKILGGISAQQLKRYYGDSVIDDQTESLVILKKIELNLKVKIFSLMKMKFQ